MATRKTKRYNEGGMAPEMGGPRAPDQEAPIGPRDTGYMDDYRVPSYGRPRSPMDNEPTKSGNNALAGQLTKLMGGSARGAGDGIPLGQQAMGTSDDGPANLAAMMGRAKKGVGIPAMPPQDTGPTLGSASGREPMDGPTPNPMVGALKNILANNMGRRGRNPGRARAMGANMGGFSAGGSVSKASSRADGIAQRGKTRGKMR